MIIDRLAEFFRKKKIAINDGNLYNTKWLIKENIFFTIKNQGFAYVSVAWEILISQST
jgi:hypothetical protein